MTDVWQAALPGLTQAQYEAFTLYYRMLIETNAVMNLTAITAPEDVAVKHFADSLSALAYLPEGASVVDVGTGAGFPAVPLLIVRPSLKMTLLDALKKRLTFVEGVLDALGLSARTAHLRGRTPAVTGPSAERLILPSRARSRRCRRSLNTPCR